MDASHLDDTNCDFPRTKNALVALQNLLTCSQCSQLTRNVCTLGNCAHMFCKTCVVENLGGSCPSCGTPAHARDAQVNKQLSNIITLSLELQRVLSKAAGSPDEIRPARGDTADHKSVAQVTDREFADTQGGDDVMRSPMAPDQLTPRRTRHGEEQRKQDAGIAEISGHSTKTPPPASSISRRRSSTGGHSTKKNKNETSTPQHKAATPKTGAHEKTGPKSASQRQDDGSRTVRKTGRKSGGAPSPGTGNTSSVRKSMEGKRNTGPISSRVKRNAKGETPLHVATIKGDISAIRKFLDNGDSPNVRDNAGWTPLHEAVNHGNTKAAELLLKHGAMVNIPGMENDTPLHDAVCNNRVECVRLLVSYGASTSARNIHGRTPLDLARTPEMREALNVPVIHRQVVASVPEAIDAADFLPLCFLGTQLNRDQRGQLQKCASKLHAKVVEEYCLEVTHVVSWCNEDGQCPRTLKYLQAIMDGKWIVTLDWISVCLEYGEKVPEEPFEIPGSSLQPNSNAPQKARLNRRQQLPGLFDGCQMYLHGTFSRVPPNRHELTELLRKGGAQILTREPRLSNLDDYDVTVPYHASPGSSLADCGIFIVHDEGPSAPRVEATRIRSVPASWVLDCIATFSLLEPKST